MQIDKPLVFCDVLSKTRMTGDFCPAATVRGNDEAQYTASTAWITTDAAAALRTVNGDCWGLSRCLKNLVALAPAMTTPSNSELITMAFATSPLLE